MRLRQISPEVAIADEALVRITRTDVSELKMRAMESQLGRSRICAHREGSDPLHEMLIALCQQTYIRPHRHLAKSESFHIIEGQLEVVFFDEAGKIVDLVQMGERDSGLNFFYRLSEPLFHTLLIQSPIVVIHETTNGPFKREESIFAEWSPLESDSVGIQRFQKELSNSVSKLRKSELQPTHLQ